MHAALATAQQPPLAVFSDCHTLTLRQCEALRRLALYVHQCGCDVHARRFGQHLVRCFDQLVPRGHEQEEALLFPAVLESMTGSDAVCLREVSSGLTWQHRSLETQWDTLRAQVCALCAGQADALDLDAVDAFIDAHRRHIDLEESEFLPMAARLLPEDEMERLREDILARHPDWPGRAIP
jgi:hemerythrin-like domain-containing protein